jgi:hypothetical protein
MCAAQYRDGGGIASNSSEPQARTSTSVVRQMMQVLQQQLLLQLLQLLLQLHDFCSVMRLVARFFSLQQPLALLQAQNDSLETLYCRTPPQPLHTMTPAY